MSEKTDVWQGTLALMALKTLEALGPLHGYGIARRHALRLCRFSMPPFIGRLRHFVTFGSQEFVSKE